MLKRLLTMGLFTSFVIQSVPATIAIIRHGEKQVKTDSNGKPVYKNGKLEYTLLLSVKGWERAYALVPFFTMNEEYKQFGTPAGIFASRPSATEAIRPYDTVLPLAESLKMQVQDPYHGDKNGPENLAKYILNSKELDGKYVIISYPHGKIPRLAKSLGISQAPKKWPSAKVFDRVWLTRFDKNGKVISFENRAQKLLYGDSKK